MKLSNLDRDSLSYPMIEEEVKLALWSMKAFKAPGPDGLHAGFFQFFWPTVGASMVQEVQKIFSEKRVPRYLNETLIALISKIQGLETLGNYRPISLCNIVYKTVTKLIVNRMRPLLDKIISPFQTAFVPGRRGTGNTIIVQELVHTISKAKGKEGYLATKIDLEKSYDKLEWGSIRDKLISVNFPSELV